MKIKQRGGTTMGHEHCDNDCLSKLTILYVEDDSDARLQLEKFLQRRCRKLIATDNGAAGLEAFRSEPVDLVITDILMPQMDGLEMVEQIRMIDASVPVIVTTAFENREYLMHAIDIGVDQYVTKPVDTKRLLAALLECSRRLRVEQQLALASRVFESSMEAIIVTDAEHRIISVNPAFTTITGFSAAEVLGKTPRVLSSGAHDKEFYDLIRNEIAHTGCWQGEIVNRNRDGGMATEYLTITTVTDRFGRISNYVGIFSDITERKQAEERIHHLALHDPLTGLPNRILLKVRMDMAMANANRSGGQLALLFIDLDNFKGVNDSLGHNTGDRFLQDVARRLQGLFRASDTVSRLGGDEFVVIINSVTEESDVITAAEKICSAVAVVTSEYPSVTTVTSSTGISIYPDDGTDLETLLAKADSAMYRAKQHGKDCFRFYGKG